jgi:hypothetical protein
LGGYRHFRKGVILADKQIQNRKEMDLSTLNLSSLAHLCRQETDRYFQRAAYDDSYCFELFRRAIEQKDETAWTIIVNQYDKLVRAWVKRHHSFALVDEDQDYFVNRAFDNFWSAFSRDPHKISKFSNLKSLLQYLKLCTYTAVQEYAERRMHPSHLTLSEKPIEAIAKRNDSIGSVDDGLIAGIVWQYVLAAVKTEQERVIIEDFLLYNMKPREIYARHPDLFADVVQVSRVKGNFMTRLRRNKQLLAIIAELD